MHHPSNAYRALLAALAACALAAGCTDSAESGAQDKEQKQDHVWKGQTQAIDKARDVERQLGEAAKKQGAAQ